MASEELFYATIRDIGSRLRRRAISPVELTRAHLERTLGNVETEDFQPA